jgi:hypothetical protein
MSDQFEVVSRRAMLAGLAGIAAAGAAASGGSQAASASQYPYDDHRAIEALLVRYAVALDSRDYGLLDEVFLPESTALYHGVGECQDRAAIVSLVGGVLDKCGPTHHLLGNYRIAVTGDRAVAKCYLTAVHGGLGDYVGAIMTVCGEYRDKLVRSPSGWRIERRELLTTLQFGDDIGLG